MDKKKNKYDVDIPKEVLDAFYNMPQYSRISDSICDLRILSEIRVIFMGKDLQALNGLNKLALWAGQI